MLIYQKRRFMALLNESDYGQGRSVIFEGRSARAFRLHFDHFGVVATLGDDLFELFITKLRILTLRILKHISHTIRLTHSFLHQTSVHFPELLPPPHSRIFESGTGEDELHFHWFGVF